MSWRNNAVADEYGNLQSNPITPEIEALREQIDYGNPVWLGDPELVKITRLRLISDPGFPFFDVSYCYGELKDGTPVYVHLPWHQFRKRGLKGHIIQMCREAKVYAKGLGLLDDDVLSILT